MPDDTPQPASGASTIPPEPLEVLKKFLEASLRRDEEVMRTCLSRKTLESGQFSSGGPEGVTFQLGEPSIEGDYILVPVKATPIDAPPDSPPAMELPALMIHEEGGWKLDLATTMERMMGGGLEAAMGQVAEAMAQAVQGIGEAFSEGMSQAFGGGGESEPPPNWDNVSLVPDEDELFPMPAMTPLPKLQEALTAAVGSPVIAEAAIDDLLKQLGSDQREGLITWMDDQLFAAWGGIFENVKPHVTLKDQLRAVRIEAAAQCEDRFLAIDGSDLVYRMNLNFTEGYHSDAEILQILPGVLAGLPETIEPTSAGHRLLRNDEEYGNIKDYAARIAARYMRRISDLLGRPIALEHDFDYVHDPDKTTRELQRWGLNRVFGTIALMKFDSTLRDSLEGLKRIKIKLEYDERGRFAEFKDGLFEMGIKTFRGDKGCFYEHELVQVFQGESLAENLVLASEDAATSSMEQAPAEDATNASQNAELFESAVTSLRSAEDAWRQQLEMCMGHPVDLHLDYDALGGQYELIQPFIHQALSGGLAGISTIGFDPAWRDKVTPIERVVISLPGFGEPTSAELSGGTLTLRVHLEVGDAGWSPNQEVADAVRVALGGEAAPAAEAEPAAASEPADAFVGDPYEQSQRFVERLEQVLRDNDLWPGERPDGPLEVKGAFGSENMEYETWLAWVLIPRVRQIIADRDTFPNGSALAVYGRRSLDGVPGVDEVIDVLAEFDAMVNKLAGV